MRHYLVAAVLLLACAPHRDVRGPDIAVARAPLDSIVLERTMCFGPCPVYRLRIDANSRVHFASPDPKGVGTLVTDRLEPWVPDTLAAHAHRIGFADLPDDIRKSDDLCRFKWTDHPGIRLAIYGAAAKQVQYDTGCYVGSHVNARVVAPQLAALAEFAARIDSLARVERWVKPHARR